MGHASEQPARCYALFSPLDLFLGGGLCNWYSHYGVGAPWEDERRTLRMAKCRAFRHAFVVRDLLTFSVSFSHFQAFRSNSSLEKTGLLMYIWLY